ncbi:MAG: hypothetical protein AB1633_08895, partial [Elusimicrobiota bacterium]
MKSVKNNTLMFLALLIILDAAGISLGNISSWWLRFSFNLFSIKYREFILLKAYVEPLPYVIIIWLLILALTDAYRDFLTKRSGTQFFEVFRAATIGTTLNAALTFAWRKYSYSRIAILYSWSLTIIFLFFGRVIVKSIWKLWIKSGFGLTRVILVGPPEKTASIARIYASAPQYRIAGVYSLTDMNGFSKNIPLKDVEEVIVFLSKEKIHHLSSIMEDCLTAETRLRVVSDFFDIPMGKISVSQLGSMNSLEFNYGLLNKWNRSVKRLIDVIISIIILSLTMPLTLL